MHPVKNGISSGRKVRTALAEPSKNVEKFLPILVHDKHLMCSIPM
tara:strand:+ start:2592 stop:2726 length:135 start_codon:yes stop_codon:yes gene_type:complete